MAFLKSLSLYHFRNLRDQTLQFSTLRTAFVGLNGAGKTNILEALYYLSYGSSFRSLHDKEVPTWGEQDFLLRGVYALENQEVDVRVGFDHGKKSIRVNGKSVASRKELLSLLPCIVFSYEDIDLVTGPPEGRRRHLDQVLSLSSPGYLEAFLNYRKVLKERNMLLRKGQIATLSLYTKELIRWGLRLSRYRADYVSYLEKSLTEIFRDELKRPEKFSVRYDSSFTSDSTESALLSRYEAISSREQLLRATLLGPHRDKLLLFWEGKEARSNASVGQKRLCSLLLKLCQSRFYAQSSGKSVSLLVDDVFLELDGETQGVFMGLLPENSQRFSTFLPQQKQLGTGDKRDFSVYHVEKGSASLEPAGGKVAET